MRSLVAAALLVLVPLSGAAEETEAPPSSESDRRLGLLALTPDLAFVADFALAAFSAPTAAEAARWEGGAQDPRASGFNLQQLELAFGKELKPLFRVDGALVFRRGRFDVDEAYATTLGDALPYAIHARIGKLATRVSRLNIAHAHTWDFVDQPFSLTRFFGPLGNRAVGLELSHVVPLDRGPFVRALVKPYLELVGSVTDAGAAGATRSFAGEAEGFSVRSPLDLQYTLAALQQLVPSSSTSVVWQLSMASGPNAAAELSRSTVFGGDLQVDWRPSSWGGSSKLTLLAEGLLRVRDLGTEMLRDWTGYASLGWRSPAWGMALRYELGTPARGGAGGAASDALDPDWIANRHRFSGSVTVWPTELARIRAQLSLDFPRWQTQPNLAGFVAFEFAVGAHEL